MASPSSRIKGASHGLNKADNRSANDSVERVESIKEELVEARKELEREKQRTDELKAVLDVVTRKTTDDLQKLREEIQALKQAVGVDASIQPSKMKQSPSLITTTSERSSTIPTLKVSSTKRLDTNLTGSASAQNLTTPSPRPAIEFSDDVANAKTKRSKDDLDISIPNRRKLESSESAVDEHTLATQRKLRRRSHVRQLSTEHIEAPSPPGSRSAPTTRKNVRSVSMKEKDSSRIEKRDIHKKHLKSSDGGELKRSASSTPENELKPSRRAHRVKLTSQIVHSDDERDAVGGNEMAAFDAERRRSTADTDADSVRSFRKKIESKYRKAAKSELSGQSGTGSNETSSTMSRSDSIEAQGFDVKSRIVLQKDKSTGTLSIRGATVSELIRRLVGLSTTSDFDHSHYTQTFLLTFHSFVSPSGLFKRLVDHFTKTNDKEVQQRVVDFIELWLEDRYQDFFKGEDEVSIMLQAFITECLQKRMNERAAALQRLLDEKRYLFRKRFKRQIEKQPSVTIPLSGIKDILSFKYQSIAAELTMQINELFQRIEPFELLQKSKDNSKIREMIAHFNKVSLWVQSEIVKQDQLSKRAKVLQHVIKVALACQEMQNYDTTAAIISALESAAVYRLKQTWAKVEEDKPKLILKYKTLQAITSCEENYKVYRQLIANVKPPAIPSISVYLKDITFINDGNPDTLGPDFGKPNLINFNKREKLADVILEIRKFQAIPYSEKRTPVLEAYLMANGTILDEDSIWQASQIAEPRNK